MVPELAARLVATPLVVCQQDDSTCNIALYDTVERPTIIEGSDREAAESLAMEVHEYWSKKARTSPLWSKRKPCHC